MEAKLMVVAGGPKDQIVQLTLPAVVGRSREADITIPHPLVSRRHCEIILGEDGQLQVNDLGSLNGTFVGKNRVEESKLAPGALLTIGAVTFRAVYGSGDASSSTDGAEASFEPIGDEPDFVLTEDTLDDELENAETELLPTEDKPPAKQQAPSPSNGSSGDEADFDLDWLSEEDA